MVDLGQTEGDNLKSDGLFIARISILVFVELALGVDAIDRMIDSMIVVSILVFVELALGG